MTRVAPVPASQWSEPMFEALAAMSPPNPRYALCDDPDRPRALNILGGLAHHPDLARAFLTFNGHLLLATTLTERQRELLVMRVAAVTRSDYEWAQHTLLARDAGLSDEEIDGIATGPNAPCWGEFESALLGGVDELVTSQEISDSTWAALTKELGNQQILDVIFTVGAYSTLAAMVRSLQIPLDAELR